MDYTTWPEVGTFHASTAKANKKEVAKTSFAKALSNQSLPTTLATAVENNTETENVNVAKKSFSSPEEFTKWKETQRLKKEAIKHEKKLRKEENFRRQIVAPKGYRVQLVSSSVATTSTTKSAPAVAQCSYFTDAAFPTLGSPVLPRARFNIEDINDNESEDVEKKKSKKKREPLTIDLKQILVQRSKKQQPKRHNIKLNKKLSTKKEEFLSGNPLDSSQPIRHRGKVREQPKPKRPTTLKAAILKHRLTKKLNKKSDKSLIHIKDINIENCDNVETILKNDDLGDINDKINKLDLKELKLEDIKIEKNIDNEESNKIEEDITLKKEAVVEEKDNKDVKSIDIPQDVNLKISEMKLHTYDALHSSRYRKYCDHMQSHVLDENIKTLLKSLVSIQDRAYVKAPDKAKTKKKMLTGLHEARKALILKKCILFILAPDLEKCPEPGGLDCKISELISLAQSNNIPYTFALGRRKLGYVLLKKVPVSCVAITNVVGAESLFTEVLSKIPPLRELYNKVTGNETESTSTDAQHLNKKESDVNKLVVSSLLSALEESLQKPKLSPFLQAIEAVEDND